MRIALNAQLLSWSRDYRSGGISRYIHHLLIELARDPRGHEYHVFTPTLPPPEDPARQGALHFHATGAATARPTLRIAWEQAAFPAHLAALRPDLLHATAFASPVAWGGPTVVTIYDLSFLRFPEAFKTGNRVYLSAMSRSSARRARRIVTISEHSKMEIVRLLRVPEFYVDVTYPAVDERYRPLPKEEIEAFRRTHSLPEAFVFSVGTLEPRKNLVGLLEAYARMPSPRPALYVAGAAGWRFSPIFDRVAELGIEDNVHFLGFVPEEELPLWYNAARLFAFPSLYEGFGLPVLEAMACGTPVITSNVASLPEVAGKAAVLVPPQDPGRLAEEMQRILADHSQQAAMRAAGLIQATRFSWAAMADGTVDAYERAVAERY